MFQKGLSAGLVLFLLASFASSENLGACVTSTNGTILETWGGQDPNEGTWGEDGMGDTWGGGGIGDTWGFDLFDPNMILELTEMIDCFENMTETQCSDFAANNFNLSYAWIENGSCELPGPPSPTDFGACMLSGGMYDGYCVDNVSNLECQQYSEMEDGISALLLVNRTCSEFAGACRFSIPEPNTIPDTWGADVFNQSSICESMGETAVWLGDECCFDGLWEDVGNLWINQGLCEREDMLNGTFDGIGSTCGGTTTTTTLQTTTTTIQGQTTTTTTTIPGQTTTTTIPGPIPAPEYPTPYIPILASLLTVSAMFLITKWK
jgi:hypothetical protein